MPIDVRCGSCGGQFSYADEHAGAVVNCTSCGAVLKIEAFAAALPPGYTPIRPYERIPLTPAGIDPFLGYFIAGIGLPVFVFAWWLGLSWTTCFMGFAGLVAAGTGMATVWKGYSPVKAIPFACIPPAGLVILSLMEDPRNPEEPATRSELAVLSGIVGAIVPCALLYFLGAYVFSDGMTTTTKTNYALNDPDEANRSGSEPGDRDRSSRKRDRSRDKRSSRKRSSKQTSPDRNRKGRNNRSSANNALTSRSDSNKPRRNTNKPRVPSLKGPATTPGRGANTVAWRVQVDPGATFKVASDLSIELDRFYYREVFYSRTNSPYLLTGKVRRNGKMKFHDLRDGSAKALSLPQRCRNFAVDPKGRWIAFSMLTKPTVIQVWSVGRDAEIAESQNQSSVRSFQATGRGNLVSLVPAGADYELKYFKVTDNSLQPQKVVTVGKSPAIESLCVSPGGRFAALFFGDYRHPAIKLFDLDTGEQAGELKIELEKKPYVRALGLGFSPDGKELAGLFTMIGEKFLISWDMASGREVFQHKLDRAIASRLGSGYGIRHPLQWTPSRSHILVLGEAVFNCAVRGGLRILDGRSLTSRTRRLLSDREFFEVDRQEKRLVARPLQ